VGGNVLDGLSERALRELVAWLESGRLPPFSPFSLPAEVGPAKDAVAAELTRITEEGLTKEHLAYFLNLMAMRAQPSGSRPELVGTGPDAPGYPMRDTRIVVHQLFHETNDSILLAGFAVYQGREIFKPLADRMDERSDLRVRMFLDIQRPHSDTSADSEIVFRFSQRFREQEWPGARLPEVYYDPRSLDADGRVRPSLHAKFVVSDAEAVFVTSANFTEAAQARNIETGVLLRDAGIAAQLTGYFLTLVDRGALIRVPEL
jgi:hypothetical protein